MTLQNAIKKLITEGFKVTNTNKRLYWAHRNHKIIDFLVQDGDIRSIRMRSADDKDDIQTDYFAGVCCDNLSQAIRLTK